MIDDALKRTEVFDFLTPPQQPDEIGRPGAYRVLKVLDRDGTCVTPAAAIQSLKASKSAVMVPKVRTSLRTVPLPCRQRRQATTVFL